MRHIKLKHLVQENQSQRLMKESLEKDLAYLQEKLIEEGLWDAIKQKVGGALEKTSDKAKELLLKPLIKVIMDKVAKDDPQGYAQLQQYASKDPKNIEKLMDHPDIKKQQAKVEKELQTVKEELTEQERDDFIQEYIDAVLEEARVLRDDPRNVKRRERYAQRKAARAAGTNTGNTGNTKTVNVDAGKKEDPPTDSDNKNVSPNASNKEEPSAEDMYKQGKWKPTKPAKDKGIGGLPGAVDKLGIKAIEKTGDAIVGAGNLIKKGLDTKAGQAAKSAVGGLVSKVYSWAKAHPKITAGVALGLFGALFAAASIGSGGVIPLIMGTLGAGAAGAIKGGAVGYVTGAGKDMYRQIKGGADSFTKMNYRDVNKSGMKAGKTGAKIGAAVGAGMHIGGQALAGISKIFGGGAAATTVANELASKATKDAKKIVDMLMEKGSSNVDLVDYPIGKDISLYDVLSKGDPSGLQGDIHEIARMAEALAQQKGPEEAAKYLSEKITNGLSKMDPEVLKSLVSDSAAAAVQDTAQQAAQDTAQDLAKQSGEAALAAKQAAASEKAAKALEWVTNQAERFSRGASPNVEQLRDILGNVGQGASKSYTQQMVRQHLLGRISKEGLESYFTKLAMSAP